MWPTIRKSVNLTLVIDAEEWAAETGFEGKAFGAGTNSFSVFLVTSKLKKIVWLK